MKQLATAAALAICLRAREQAVCGRKHQFFDAGEVALTATAGLQNGVIRYNTISTADFSGIQVGNRIGGNSQVRNVSVYGNKVTNTGIDKDSRTNSYALPGIAHWVVADVCTVNNYVRTPNNVGIWIHDGTHKAFPQVNERIYIAKNDVVSGLKVKSFSINKPLNYTQSGHPATSGDPLEIMEFAAKGQTTGFYGGKPKTGQDWSYGSNIAKTDADNDGFHTGCYGESNDKDPCVPDRTAATCRKS